MRFHFNVNLSERDYYDYNYFVALKSPYAQKHELKTRLVFSLIFISLAVLDVLFGDFLEAPIKSSIYYATYLIVFNALLRPFYCLIIKSAVKSAKKQSKPLYSPVSELEFFDDYFVDSTSDTKSEFKYSSVDRVSVIKGKAIYLHFNSMQSILVPDFCFTSAEQYKDFLEFIKTKCDNIDVY